MAKPRKTKRLKRANVVVPEDHPPAWGSQLWPHLELIRDLRRHRKRWVDVAGHLEQEHGLKLSHRTVRNFFARAIRAKLPLGFEPEPPPVEQNPPPPEQTYRPGDRFREAIRNQKPAGVPKPKVYKSKQNL